MLINFPRVLWFLSFCVTLSVPFSCTYLNLCTGGWIEHFDYIEVELIKSILFPFYAVNVFGCVFGGMFWVSSIMEQGHPG